MRRNVVRFAFLVSVALAAACGSKSSGSSSGFPSSGDQGSSGNAGAGGDDATTGSAGSTAVTCGSQTCGASEVCCYGTGGGATAAPGAMTGTCMAAGSCQGSSLSCTTQNACPGQTCCFTFTQNAGGDDAGAAGGFGGFALPATSGPFTATCQDTCPTTGYRLCAMSSECQSGETCGPGTYSPYCGAAAGGGIPGFGDAGFGGGFPGFGDAGFGGGFPGFGGDAGFGGFPGFGGGTPPDMDAGSVGSDDGAAE
jgi:hypothetical protein